MCATDRLYIVRVRTAGKQSVTRVERTFGFRKSIPCPLNCASDDYHVYTNARVVPRQRLFLNYCWSLVWSDCSRRPRCGSARIAFRTINYNGRYVFCFLILFFEKIIIAAHGYRSHQSAGSWFRTIHSITFIYPDVVINPPRAFDIRAIHHQPVFIYTVYVRVICMYTCPSEFRTFGLTPNKKKILKQKQYAARLAVNR